MSIGAGCGSPRSVTSEKSSDAASHGTPDYEVWSTYNTMRVVQDPALNVNYEKHPAGITAEMAKNELESAQLFITTNEYMSIDYFELIPADLTSENGDVFSGENADVYVQRYVDITEHSYFTNVPEYPLGWMPDGLIPMDLSNKYGENVVAENRNQGITVDFITTKDTPAGMYTGNYVLRVNDEEKLIPVELTVWDFALPEESSCNSAVLIYETGIMYGEMTTVRSEIDEYYKAYYDTLLRYKLNGTWVPYALVSPSALVWSVLEYWDHPNFQTYAMPHYTFISDQWNGWTQGFYEYYLQSMLGLARASTEDKILFDKMYFWEVDEPEGGVDNFETLESWNDIIENLKQDVEDTLTAEGFFNGKSDSFRERLLKSLHDVQHVCTLRYLDYREGKNGDLTYCPHLSSYENYYQQLSILKDAQENNNGMWYYTTISTIPPHPTQFIDDFMITGREMKWMQKSFGLEAWLYWAADAASKLNATDVLSMNINPYDTAFRFQIGNIANGDGYLVLAGSRYGQKSPIATQRLLAYREGQDDLDMMNYLDSIYAEYNDYYDLPSGTISFNNVHAGLFDRMFCRMISYRSDAILKENREIIADTIHNALTLNDKFAYTIDYSGNYATYKFYLADGYGIKANGSALQGIQSGNGKVYTYSVNLLSGKLLSSVEITSIGTKRTVTLYDDSETKAVAVVGNGAINASASESSRITETEDGLIFDIKSVEKDNIFATMRFSPKITVVNFNKSFRTIELDLENLKDATVIMTLNLIGEDGSSHSADISLTANTECTVEVLNRLNDGVKVKSLEIVFENGELKGEEIILKDDRRVKLTGIRLK